VRSNLLGLFARLSTTRVVDQSVPRGGRPTDFAVDLRVSFGWPSASKSIAARPFKARSTFTCFGPARRSRGPAFCDLHFPACGASLGGPPSTFERTCERSLPECGARSRVRRNGCSCSLWWWLLRRSWRELFLLRRWSCSRGHRAISFRWRACFHDFVEAAGALTVAYLAVEILWLPEAGARWA